jgi:pyruvate dehydrogenase E1 component alpha subunit
MENSMAAPKGDGPSVAFAPEGDPSGQTDSVIAKFDVHFRHYLDPKGQLLGEPPAFAKDPEIMKSLYRTMTLVRTFDYKAVALQRTGQIGTYPSCLGQEAIGVGYASVMTDKDVMFITYREQAAQISRGVTLTELLQYWGGDERGCNYAVPREDFPVAVPIASQAPHAVGVATAFKLRCEPRVAVCALGDGASSKGDFYESINLAGVWQLPAVFIVINNHWAISLPVEKQTATKTLAQKAIAAGIPGVQIDGNDIVAVRQVVGEAMHRARNGGGPSVIEAFTYRMGDHTTADDASRYRGSEDISAAWKNDPLARLRAYLGNQGWWSKEDEEKLIADCKDKVEAAVAEYSAIPPPRPETMFDHLFETLPAALAWQRKKLVEG